MPGGRPRQAVVTTYRHVSKSKKKLHVWRAEQALGQLLPKGAVVHHADGSITDNAPLVICQNQAYHIFLHMLMRIKAAGGSPFCQRLCEMCHQIFPFSRSNGWAQQPKRFCCSGCQRQRYVRSKWL
jgi:hypothetical protein